jgi:hypothetical protein
LHLLEEFEDIKGVIRIRRTDKTMAEGKETLGQTTIYKTLHRQLRLSNMNSNQTRGELRCSGIKEIIYFVSFTYWTEGSYFIFNIWPDC